MHGSRNNVLSFSHMFGQYEPQVPKFSRCISGKTAQKKVGDLPKVNAMVDYKTKFLKFH